MTLVSRIDTVFVPAVDPAAAAAWYRRLFTLETVFEEPDYVALRFAGAEPRNGTALTLVRAAGIDRDAHPRFNFFSAEPGRLHAALNDAGVETTPLQNTGGIRHFDFRDISGNWINICHFGVPA